MNWKEFIKPRWEKIIIFFILLLVALILPINPVGVYYPGYQGTAPPQDYVFEPLYIFLIYGFRYCLDRECIVDYIYNPTFLVIYVILFYLLSSIIVWFINTKLKKVKKK